MGWNFRLVNHKNRATGETYCQIHEAYYDEDVPKDGMPHSITVRPATLYSETEGDMRWMLNKMLESLDKPTLNYEDIGKSVKGSKES